MSDERLEHLDKYIAMRVVGKRIYCSGLSGEQQSYFIDALGQKVSVKLDGQPVRVVVRSVKNTKCILDMVKK